MKESLNGKRFKNMGKGDGRRNVNEDLDEKKEEEEEGGIKVKFP